VKRMVLAIVVGLVLFEPLLARDKQPKTIQVEIAVPLPMVKDAAAHAFIAADYALKEERERELTFLKRDMAGFVTASYLPTLTFSEADGKTILALSCKVRITGMTLPSTLKMKLKELQDRYGDLLLQIKRDVEKASPATSH